MFVPLIILAALLLWGRWRLMNKKLLEFSEKCPGPPALPVVGNALQFIVPPEELIPVFGKLIAQYGDVFRFWLGPDMNIVVSNPDDIKTLLTSSKTSIRGPQYKYFIQYCGNGILSGSGHTWRTSRKTLSPVYSKEAIDKYEKVINEEADETVKRLLSKVGGGAFDIIDDVILGTTYTVCQTLIGLTREQSVNLPKLTKTFLQRSHESFLILFMRMTTWHFQIDPIFWMTKYHKQQQEFVEDYNEMAGAIVQHRLKVLEAMDDERKMADLTGDNLELGLVDRLLLSKQSYNEILKQLFAAFFTSQDPTGKITSFMLLMLAYHAECQDKLHSEIKNCTPKGDVTDEDLKNMPYLDMVFKETVRLFPPAVMLQRTLAEDITISNGMTLPAGSSLVIPLMHLHRDKKHWVSPDAFDPERFSPENTRMRHPNCFIPFSQGPMGCLGRSFAYKQIKTTCVKILREFRLSSPETYSDLRLVMAISAASVNGYPVQLHRRS